MRAPIYRPLTSWREMESAEKFLAYNRWSLITMVVAIAVAFGFTAGNALAALGMTLAGALAAAALHCEPLLRIEPQAHGRRIFRIGLFVHFGLIVVSWVTLALGTNEYIQRGTLAVVLLCFFNLMLAFTPFLHHGFLITCAVAAVGAVFTYVQGLSYPLFAIFAVTALVTPATLWTVRLMIDAHHARYLEAELQVSEERLRFSQDLHDTMGQHLAALSIKIQLAQKLAALDPARLDPARLNAELASLRHITDTAVDDMRHVVGAYRNPTLASEVTGVVSLLRGAGIAVSVTGTPEDVAPNAHEVAAWFIRETATNILRHADAQTAVVELSRAAVSASNDNPHGGTGVGAGRGTGSGTGIVGLRRRAAAIGARVVIDHTLEAFTITLELP